MKTTTVLHDLKKKNPLKNRSLMNKLNPYDAVKRANEQKTQEERHKKRVATIKDIRKSHKKAKVVRRQKFNKLWAGLEESNRIADKAWEKMENEFKVAEGQEVDEEDEE